MLYYLLDEEGVVTEEQIIAAAEVGFDHLVTKPTERLEVIADVCLRQGLKVTPIIADWGDVKESHPEMAFLNHDGKSSFDSRDPRVPPNNWPSFWHPEAVDLIRDQFRLSAQAAGTVLDGFLIGIGHGDASCMPTNWWDCENGNKLCTDNWVFDEWAEAEARRVYGEKVELKHHPEDDYDLRTLNFIQLGMIKRMEEIALAACEIEKRVWCMILPFANDSSINMARGYTYDIHRRWAQWAKSFARRNGASVGFAFLNVLRDAQPTQVAQAAAMVDPANMGCECLIGVHSEKNYLFKVQSDIQTARDLGMTGTLCPLDRLDDLFGKKNELIERPREESIEYKSPAETMVVVEEEPREGK